MISALSLWLSILVSAVLVFIASSVIHKVPAYHRGGFETGKSLVLWFVYCILTGLFAAYLAGLALDPGANYLAVFRFVGTASFGGYALALLQNSIWNKRSWLVTIKYMLDGFVYACLTAGVFAWLWPG